MQNEELHFLSTHFSFSNFRYSLLINYFQGKQQSVLADFTIPTNDARIGSESAGLSESA